MRRVVSLQAIGGALLLGGALTGWTASADAQTPSCSVEEVDRVRLELPGSRPVYVEAMAYTPSGTEHLLAGAPNYIFSPESDRLVLEARDSIFGVVVTSDGGVRAVPKPIDGNLSAVRATAGTDGTWLVAFAELVSGTRFPEAPIAERLWFGSYGPDGWSTLEELPVPPRAHSWFSVSSLASTGDTVAWAFRIEPTGAVGEAGVYYYERVDGEWRYELLPIPNMTEVELIHSGRRGFLLTAVHSAPEVGIMSSRALHVYARSDGWALVARVDDGGIGYAHHVRAVEWHGEVVLGWTGDDVVVAQGARGLARMASRPLSQTSPTIVTVATDNQGSVAQVVGPEIGVTWITRRIDDDPDSAELRLFRSVGDQVEFLGSLSDPYTGNFAASWTGPETLTVVGPLWAGPTADSWLASLLLTLRVHCGP